MEKLTVCYDTSGAFTNPLRAWGNDDILCHEAARHSAQAEHPAAFRVLDWPELRGEFWAHETASNAAKRTSRRLGIGAATLAGFGTAGLSLVQVAPEAFRNASTILALLLSVAATGAACWHLLHKSGRRRWMAGRIWTERLRQLYFQFIVNNITLAVTAMRDDTALAEWQAKKAAVLAGVVAQLRQDSLYRPDFILADTTQQSLWLLPEWQRAIAPPSDLPSRDLLSLLQRLREQRIMVQIRYAAAKMQDSIHTPATIAKMLPRAAIAFTLLVFGLSLVAGVAIILGHEPRLFLALSGAAAAIGLTLRVIEQGSQVQRDLERYEWYLPAVESLKEHFDRSEVAGKIGALRDLEAHSYQELRQFVRAHSEENFLS